MAAILTLRRGAPTPSLAQSELFFNTSTETLNVGGTSGVITLVKIGENSGNITLSGDLSINGDITGSNLKLSGDANITGNITLGGNIILGDSGSDQITVNASLSGSLIPDTTEVYDLGSSDKKYRNIFTVSASFDSILLPGSGILSSSTDNFTDFSQSVDSRLDNLQLDSQSQDSRLDSLELFSSSQESNNDDIIELFATASNHETRIDDLTSFTGSYATTGSNVFRGNQTISGSVNISGSTTILGSVNANLFMNPKTLTADIIVPDNTNALVLGPVNVGGSISLGLSSSLLVLPEDFTSFASTGSNQFRGNQYITGSIIPEGSGSHDLGSLTNPFRDLYLSSASLRIVNDGEILSEISANSERLLVSASETYFTGNVNVSGSVTAQLFIGSFSGSLSAQDSRLDSLESFTSSQETKNTTLGTYTSSVDDRLSQLETNTGSQESDLIELFSTASNHEDRIDGIENYTSSLKQAIDVSGQDLTIYGNLIVQGDTTTLNTTELIIEDKILSLASGSTDSAMADGAGLHISGADASILWNNSQNSLVINQKVSSSVGFKGDGSELTGVTANSVDFDDITNKPTLVSSSDQVTQSLDLRYLEIDGDGVVSGSSQINISGSSGFDIFSGSLKTTDDGQDSRLNNLELTSASHDNRILQLEFDSGSQGNRISSLESFTSSQEILNGFYNSYTQSNDTDVNELFSTASEYQLFSESIDSIIKNKIDFEGVVSSSSDTSTISLSIQNGVISGSVIGGVVSGSDQITSSLDGLYEVSGSVAQLVGIYQVSGSLGSAAWYNVSASISDGNPQVLGNAGAVKAYIDEALVAVGAGDITKVTAGLGMSGSTEFGEAVVAIDTASAHFTNGVLGAVEPFSSSVSASLNELSQSSGYINYVTNSIENLTGIEVADFDSNVAVTFIDGTLKFIFGTPAVPTSVAASLSGFLNDRFNQVQDEYNINGNWNNGGYTLISASLFEDSTLLTKVGTGTSLSFTTTTSGSHTYQLQYTASSPLDGSIFTTSTTVSGTLSKSNPASPTLTPTATVQLGASGNQIEQGATGSISFTSSSADPSNSWNLVDVTTNVESPYFVTGSATGSSSISIIATANYESPIGDNNPDLTTTSTNSQTYNKIRSLRHGASTAESFTEGDLANLALWDTALGGDVGTIVKGTTNPSGQSVTITWSGDKFHYIVFDSSRSNLSNITSSGFGVFGSFTLSTVGQYKIYKINTLQAGGAGSTITYTLT
jgi:uncharacterized coiled-coil protein SlyX